MEFGALQPTAWTPDIGGKFGDWQLEIKPVLRADRRDQYIKMLKNPDVVNGKMKVDIKTGDFIKNYEKDIICRVVNWRNLVYAGTGELIPCNDKTKRDYLSNLADAKTGHFSESEPESEKAETEPKPEPLSLLNYIDEFSGTMSNFEKNSSSTASIGVTGGSNGSGSTPNS
jgi:hypothetical protein